MAKIPVWDTPANNAKWLNVEKVNTPQKFGTQVPLKDLMALVVTPVGVARLEALKGFMIVEMQEQPYYDQYTVSTLSETKYRARIELEHNDEDGSLFKLLQDSGEELSPKKLF